MTSSQDDIHSANEQRVAQPIKLHFLEQFQSLIAAIPLQSSGPTLSMEEKEVEEPLHHVLSTLIGYLQIELGSTDEALTNLDHGGLSLQENLLVCITREFVRAVKDNTFYPTDFLT